MRLRLPSIMKTLAIEIRRSSGEVKMFFCGNQAHFHRSQLNSNHTQLSGSQLTIMPVASMTWCTN